MKILRLVLITSLILTAAQYAMAQVKIGDNPLDVTAGRQLEIEKQDTFLLVTDNLEFGTADNLENALMLKLFGYGLGNFFPTAISPFRTQGSTTLPGDVGITSNVFLGITDDGKVLEVPLRLNLEIRTSDTTANMAFYNGVDTFGTVDLLGLDSIFVTDYALNDSIERIRTLIGQSAEADEDTVTGNEYIDTVYIDNDTLWLVENTDMNLGPTNTVNVDLGAYLGDQTFYRTDGALEEDRTVDGDGNFLTFDNVTDFKVNSTDSTIIDAATHLTLEGDEVAIRAGGGDVIQVNNTQSVKFRSSAVDTSLLINANGTLQAEIYGDAANSDVTYTTIIGSRADGTLVDVDVNDILSRQVDSTIYNNDGSLTGDRTLTGATNDLTFTDLSDFNVDATDGVDITTDTLEVTGETKVSGLDDADDAQSFNSIVGATADGTLINITADDILAAQTDSTIYNNDGALTGDRILTGATNDLTFTGLSDFNVVATDGVDITTDTLEVTGETKVSGLDDTDDSQPFNSIVGATADGTLINITADDILAAQTDSTIYNNDGSLTGDRILTGATNDLTFTGLSDFNVDATDGVSITTDTIEITGETKISGLSNADDSQTFNSIVGATANGELINITAADILAADEDSTIYTHNGSLTAERTMDMNNFDLLFTSQDDADTVVITSDGRMGIGTSTPNAAVELEVAGDILAIQVHASSDRRFKKDISTVESALRKVMGLEGVNYNFRTDEFKGRGFPMERQLGFIAQDIEKILPEVVRTNSDGYKAVDYSKVTALLVEAIKEQQVQIAKLEGQLASSQNTNANLAGEIADIKAMIENLSNLNVADED